MGDEVRSCIPYTFHGTAFSTFSLISQKLLKISIPNFNIILRDIFGLHLFTGSGNRRVYTDSQRVLIGICGRRPLWQTTTIWQQNTLMAKCIIALLLFCQNLGQIGSVVQEKTPKKRNLCTEKCIWYSIYPKNQHTHHQVAIYLRQKYK